MKSISLLKIAASIAALTVVVIAFILVPEPLWTAITIATVIGFACSVGYVFYAPLILSRKQHTADASQIAAIGPLGAISIVLLMATGGGFVLALVGYQMLGLAMLVLGVGAFLAMSLVMNSALKVVSDVSEKWAQPSHHVTWQNQLTMLASQSTHPESLEKLNLLLEKLRYSASDVLGGSPQDAGIEQIFNLMSQKLQSDPAADLTNELGPINGLLAQRDVYLRSVRSKA